MSSSSSEQWTQWLDRSFWWLTGVGVLVNLSGLTLTVMEPDAALYATVARNMAESGDFTHLIARNGDWLDKPHFPFWLTALSFRLFGINTVAYKLPGLLLWGVGILYTYRYALLLWSRTVARVAVLILLTAQHLILSNSDVRAEPFLVGLIIAAVYHYIRAQKAPGLSLHLVWGSLFAACAMMTKGPFVLLPIGGAILTDLIVRRRWRELLWLRWSIALALMLVFITPELISLYVQFDLHPEKVVFGRTGVSGVRFFFWDSQFGRFFNTGPIRGRGDPFFFLHTALWAFLPWSLWLVAAVGARIRRRVRKQHLEGQTQEVYSLGAAGLTFLVFSLSRFQLPHYLNILFPFFAVITAAWICGLETSRGRTLAARAQVGVGGSMWLLAIALVLFARPANTVWPLVFVALLVVVTVRLFRSGSLPDAVGIGFGAAVALNLVLTLFLYPELLRYQGGSEAAAYLNKLPPRPTGMFVVNSYSFEFYAEPTVKRWDLHAIEAAAQSQPIYVYLPDEALAELEGAALKVRVLERFGSYTITRVKPKFLNPATRAQTLDTFLLAEVTTTPAVRP